MKFALDSITLNAMKSFILECPTKYTEDELFQHYQKSLTPDMFTVRAGDERGQKQWCDVVTALYENAKGDKTAPVSILLAADKKYMKDIFEELSGFTGVSEGDLSEEVSAKWQISTACWHALVNTWDDKVKKIKNDNDKVFAYMLAICKVEYATGMFNYINHFNFRKTLEEPIMLTMMHCVGESLPHALYNYDEHKSLPGNVREELAKLTLELQKKEQIREAMIHIIV